MESSIHPSIHRDSTGDEVKDTPAIVAFDLDGTLVESKGPLDTEMAELLLKLLNKRQVVIVSGASYAQFIKQLLPFLGNAHEALSNLFLLTTNGGALYEYKNTGWQSVYTSELTEDQKKEIMQAFFIALEKADYKKPEEIFGEIIEDRGNQITFSGLGSEAPAALKELWDPQHEMRSRIVSFLKPLLPTYAIAIGGMTSIDVTQKSISKAYGLTKLLDHLGRSTRDLLYVGDALFPGGNDAIVRTIGVETKEVGSPADTKKLIQALLLSSK